jgi:hypothetical protein
MAAINDITGDQIKSKTSTRDYRDNWDMIFKKRTAFQWLGELYDDEYIFEDMSGWNLDDNITSHTPINKRDFDYRLTLSKIVPKLIE